MNELNIETLCVNSSQAKGRIERANRTLQDRLVKELRLAGTSDIDAANAFLPRFVERCNARSAKPARRDNDLHRALNVELDRLRDILCWRDERYVDRNLVLRYDRKRIMLEENDLTCGLVGKYVDSFEYDDGSLEFRSNGVPLPYSAFDKDQRVSHAAIIENKRPSAVLEHIKAEQDETPPKTRRAGTQATRYQPNWRRNTGWNSKLAKVAKETRAASQGCDI